MSSLILAIIAIVPLMLLALAYSLVRSAPK